MPHIILREGRDCLQSKMYGWLPMASEGGHEGVPLSVGRQRVGMQTDKLSTALTSFKTGSGTFL